MVCTVLLLRTLASSTTHWPLGSEGRLAVAAKAGHRAAALTTNTSSSALSFLAMFFM